MIGPGLLDRLQSLLARINDVPVRDPVSAFHFGERAVCCTLLGRELQEQEDEQLLLIEERDGLAASVYIDTQVLHRLRRRDPLVALDHDNLADFCTALEGVSHFQYLSWVAGQDRQLSLLELELQADVDKYAAAVWLLRRQGLCDLPGGLWRALFEHVGFVAGHSAELRRRYRMAHRHAARYCQQLERNYLCARRFRPEGWLRALREFYRWPHHQKLRSAGAF